jgi:hypothetical protein
LKAHCLYRSFPVPMLLPGRRELKRTEVIREPLLLLLVLMEEGVGRRIL